MRNPRRSARAAGGHGRAALAIATEARRTRSRGPRRAGCHAPPGASRAQRHCRGWRSTSPITKSKRRARRYARASTRSAGSRGAAARAPRSRRSRSRRRSRAGRPRRRRELLERAEPVGEVARIAEPRVGSGSREARLGLEHAGRRASGPTRQGAPGWPEAAWSWYADRSRAQPSAPGGPRVSLSVLRKGTRVRRRRAGRGPALQCSERAYRPRPPAVRSRSRSGTETGVRPELAVAGAEKPSMERPGVVVRAGDDAA